MRHIHNENGHKKLLRIFVNTNTEPIKPFVKGTFGASYINSFFVTHLLKEIS
jgi:hypothetical protein